MIGDIRLLPFQREPEGHFPCDGRELDVGKFSALYALIGESFGSASKGHFKIPLVTQVPAPGLHWYIHAFDDDFPQFD